MLENMSWRRQDIGIVINMAFREGNLESTQFGQTYKQCMDT